MASSNSSTDASLKDLNEKPVEDPAPADNGDGDGDGEQLSPTQAWLLVSSLCVCFLQRSEVHS
jgi:hypothetical protein